MLLRTKYTDAYRGKTLLVEQPFLLNVKNILS